MIALGHFTTDFSQGACYSTVVACYLQCCLIWSFDVSEDYISKRFYIFEDFFGNSPEQASTNSNGSTNCSTNCTLSVETVLFFRVNGFANVVFSKFIA